MPDLDWPAGWPRTPPGRRKRASFGKTGHVETSFGGYRTRKQLTVNDGIQSVQEEVRRMHGVGLVIETAMPTRQDGLPYSSAKTPDDPGVVVRFRLPGAKPVGFACDTWDRVADNLRAIAKTIEAKRGIERWGCATADREFAGYAALPSGDAAFDEAAGAIALPAVDEAPHVTLGVPEDAGPILIKAAWKDKMRAAHPDHGGSEAAVHRLTKARDALLAQLEASQ